MLKSKLLAVLLSTASLAVLVQPALGADSAGAIVGHVIGLKDHKPLAGAVVRIKESGTSATTNADGSYAFNDLAPGAYTLVVTTAAGVEYETRVKVAPGETTSRDLTSDNKSTALQEIVILAQRAPAAVARAAQMQAPNVVVIQTYQEIRKLPDVSAAEAVRRVPGISLETDEGEGRYVNIRGLDADLNSTTFGGLRLPPTNNASPFGGYRAVTMDSIPVGLIGAITVTKTNLPDQDAEALGGTIEITPKTAPRGGEPFIQGNIGSGYEALHGTPITDFAVTAGGHFGGPNGFFSPGPFSIVVTGTYYEDRRYFDDVEPDVYFNDPQGTAGARPYQSLGDIQQRDYELNRKRHGVGVDLGYEPNDNNSWYIRAFEAGYTERYKRQYLQITPTGSPTLLPTGQITDTLQNTFDSFGNLATTPLNKAFRDEDETSTDRVFVAGGKDIFGASTLDYRIGYTEGTYHKPYDVNSSFAYTPPPGATITYAPTGPGHVPVYTIAGAGNYLDPANYSLSSLSNSTADNFDRELSFAGNYEYPFQLVGADESVKVGVDVRLRHKRTTSPQLSYSNLPAVLPLTSVISGGNETYYNGLYQNGPDITPGLLQHLFGPGTIAPSPAPGQLSADQASTDQQYLDVKENVFAGYGEYKGTLGQLGIIAGLRVEATEDHSNAFSVTSTTDSVGNVTYSLPTPISTRHNYLNVFPGVQLRYEIQPDFIARASFSSTIARPGFNQSNPAEAIDLGSGLITHGNPDLKPATANSFDLSLEKYLGGSGIVSVGLFYKDIANYIVASTSGTRFVSGVSTPLQDVTFANASGGSYARGVEVNIDERFRMLPGLLSGLGVSANYTFVDSRFQIRPGEHSPLPSTSKHTWNAAIFYEKGPVGLRLAAYSASADLFAIGLDKTSDTYNATRTSMDFGANLKVDPHWVVYFNAKNLLNTPHAFYLGTADRPIQREFYGQTYQFGARFDY